jgi:hypothetical protein
MLQGKGAGVGWDLQSEVYAALKNIIFDVGANVGMGQSFFLKNARTRRIFCLSYGVVARWKNPAIAFEFGCGNVDSLLGKPLSDHFVYTLFIIFSVAIPEPQHSDFRHEGIFPFEGFVRVAQRVHEQKIG